MASYTVNVPDDKVEFFEQCITALGFDFHINADWVLSEELLKSLNESKNKPKSDI